MLQSIRLRSAMVSLVLLALFLVFWEMANQPPEATAAQTEYEMLMGGAPGGARASSDCRR